MGMQDGAGQRERLRQLAVEQVDRLRPGTLLRPLRASVVNPGSRLMLVTAAIYAVTSVGGKAAMQWMPPQQFGALFIDQLQASLAVNDEDHRVGHVEVALGAFLFSFQGPLGGFLFGEIVDDAGKKMELALSKIIKLAEIEETVRKLALEVEKTKRRVNALEYIVIPRLSATVKYIRMRLDEMERESFIRLKKIKAVLDARGKEEPA